LGPYIPTSPVGGLSARVIVGEPQFSEDTSDEVAEEAVRTEGEVHFGNTEFADGQMTSFPVLGVTAALTDELTNPAAVVIQLERNQPDLSPDLTDGKRTQASAELVECQVW